MNPNMTPSSCPMEGGGTAGRRGVESDIFGGVVVVIVCFLCSLFLTFWAMREEGEDWNCRWGREVSALLRITVQFKGGD